MIYRQEGSYETVEISSIHICRLVSLLRRQTLKVGDPARESLLTAIKGAEVSLRRYTARSTPQSCHFRSIACLSRQATVLNLLKKRYNLDS